MASQSPRTHIGNFRPVDKIAVHEDSVAYAAAGTSLPDVQFSENLKILKCKGVFVDYVDGIGGLIVNHRNWTGATENSDVQVQIHQLINSSSPFNTTRYSEGDLSSENALAILDDVSRCLVLDRKDRYLISATPPGFFGSSFLDLCLTAMRHPENALSDFLNWFELNRSLLIYGDTLENICLAVDPAQLGDVDIPTRDVFLSRFKDTTKSMTRRLVTTNTGYIGMGPCRVQKGDKIVVLLGCSIPLVLRPRSEIHSYEVIGEFYLHEFMSGEVLERFDGQNSEIEEFELS
ncbi:hypothetical protein GLAREA_04745 [Glarea lozoyensis ATCC 20868]|uniref:Uncharacterized protein n=1 Tax=Glarea lozoyensis (strain ATCC 20868 / MF5171) TaxID=1116229 RepID=S3CSA9_GLAL2|nr:uncharacterized protein GLAREA_04745 [Glarea lozoyensis ATCC 20868]EPE27954.1 hypothetical protein GLAREA_04745 [Glarea lozoyensis ATCC 20868]